VTTVVTSPSQCSVDGKKIPQMRYSEAPTLKRRLDMTMEPSLQATSIATHLAELAANPASLPIAPARALAGEGAGEGLGLLSLSGSSITDNATALTFNLKLFCTQYGPLRLSASAEHLLRPIDEPSGGRCRR
jgi:hypothetical protein